jgi:hypothetical protein
MRMHNPPHPGRVLREYLGAMSVTDTARHLGVTRVALSRILNGSPRGNFGRHGAEAVRCPWNYGSACRPSMIFGEHHSTTISG